MPLTADQVYDLIKLEEGRFTPPAPYVTVDVGTLDVATGDFSGLRTTSFRDPEPIQHGPDEQPVNPPPRFVGNRWISVTVDSTWHRTRTSTPAPQVPLAPVLLRFSVTGTSGAWTVRFGGTTHSVPAGQRATTVNVWDAASVSWSVTAGSVDASDRLLIQRPTGPPAAALGAFTIPVLPVSIVYAPPVDSLGRSKATYSTAQTVGTSVDIGISRETGSTVPVQATGFVGQLQGFTAALTGEATILSAAGAERTATVFNQVVEQLGQITSTQETTVSDGSESTFTVGQSTSDTAGTSAAGGGPGEGDTLHFYKDLRMIWSYLDGTLRLCPLSWTAVFVTARGLRADPAASGITDGDAASLLALDPFGTDAAAADLPADRFTLVERIEYGLGATILHTLSTTRERRRQVVRREVATDTTTWDAGPILSALGLGGTSRNRFTLTNATGTSVSSTVTATADLVSGAADYFVVNVFYDTLFGTFAFQPVPPTPQPRLMGSGAAPGQTVLLEVAGLRFRTVAGPDGGYRFRAPAIPDGPTRVTFG